MREREREKERERARDGENKREREIKRKMEIGIPGQPLVGFHNHSYYNYNVPRRHSALHALCESSFTT